MLFMLLNILPHFLLQNFFPCFPSLKPRCVLWSKKYGNLLQDPLAHLSGGPGFHRALL